MSFHWSNIINNENIKQIVRWYDKCSTFQIKKVKWCANNFLVLNSALGSGANPVGTVQAANTTGSITFSFTRGVTWTVQSLVKFTSSINISFLQLISASGAVKTLAGDVYVVSGGYIGISDTVAYLAVSQYTLPDPDNVTIEVRSDTNNLLNVVSGRITTVDEQATFNPSQTTAGLIPTTVNFISGSLQNPITLSASIADASNIGSFSAFSNNQTLVDIASVSFEGFYRNNESKSVEIEDFDNINLVLDKLAIAGGMFNPVFDFDVSNFNLDSNTATTIEIPFELNLNSNVGSSSGPVEVTSFIQRAKILHVKPKVKHGRRFTLYGGEFDGSSSNTENQAVFALNNYTLPDVVVGNSKETVQRPVITTAADSSYLTSWTYPSVSSSQKGFKILQIAAGGSVKGTPRLDNTNAAYTANTGPLLRQDLTNKVVTASAFTNSYMGAQLDATANVVNVIGNATGQANDGNSTATGDIIVSNNPLIDQYLANVADLKCYDVIGGDDSLECNVTHNMNFPILRNNMTTPVAVVSTSGGTPVDFTPQQQHDDVLFSGQIPFRYVNGLANGTAGASPTPGDTYYPCYPCSTIIPENKFYATNPAYLNYIQMMKPLQHSFLTMIPIVEGAGVVNQQANFMFEQEVVIEFNFTDGWSDNEEDNVYPSFVPMLKATGVDSNTVTYNWFMH